ncbi:MAG: hypothetical protein RXQ62_00015 [Nitrososphaeria archaeon]
MAAGRSSNQVRSKADAREAERRLNVIYWMRIAAGVAAGLASGALHGTLMQPWGALLILVLIFAATIPIARSIVVSSTSKVYYHGVGGYFIWWLVSYAAYLSVEVALARAGH